MTVDREDFQQFDLGLTSEQGAQLSRFANRLTTSPHNLISARDREQVHVRHIPEALALGRMLQDRGLLREGTRLLDLGAGGGLPGIPIRIAWPNIALTLLESVGKKCRFMEEVVSELDLEDVTVIEGRAEAIGHDPRHREQYDLVVARAVAPLPVLIEYALPLLRVGGHLAAVKGSRVRDEVDASSAALAELAGRINETPMLSTSQHPAQTVVLVEKLTPTPDRYPRRSGIPSKRPL